MKVLFLFFICFYLINIYSVLFNRSLLCDLQSLQCWFLFLFLWYVVEMMKLGRSELSVSRLGIGTLQWGDPGSGFGATFGEAELATAFDELVAGGINFFDTAEATTTINQLLTYLWRWNLLEARAYSWTLMELSDAAGVWVPEHQVWLLLRAASGQVSAGEEKSGRPCTRGGYQILYHPLDKLSRWWAISHSCHEWHIEFIVTCNLFTP